MFSDIIDLRDFYQSSLGLMTKRVLRARTAAMWPNMRGERVLVLGYGVPLLRSLSQQAAALYAFMPAAQGASYWPRDGANVSSLVDLKNLPLSDASIDRVILLHVLEGAAEPESLLGEVWRVLKGTGRLLTIVPNRRGLWAHSDQTPFGTGQPFSPSQVKKSLHSQGFLVERSEHALYALPSASRLALSFADKIEKFGAFVCPGFGGILMLEASKQLYAPLPAPAQIRHRLVLPMSMPVAQPT
jgi:SAM-dependent methyltransferase